MDDINSYSLRIDIRVADIFERPILDPLKVHSFSLFSFEFFIKIFVLYKVVFFFLFLGRPVVYYFYALDGIYMTSISKTEKINNIYMCKRIKSDPRLYICISVVVSYSVALHTYDHIIHMHVRRK